MKTKTTYVIDSCALINAAHQYNMSKAAFAPIWGKFDTMIKNGEILSSEEIIDELKDEDLSNWAKSHKDAFYPLTKEIQEKTTDILKEYPTLIQIKSSGNSNGDPFLIATAVLFNGCVVTDEKLGDTKNGNNYKIPNVCAAMKIPYIGLREFMDRILD